MYSSIKNNKVYKKRNGIKWNGDLRAKFNPVRLPVCEKELRKSLEPGVVTHTFNPSTAEAEAGGSPSLKQVWSQSKFWL